MKVLCWDLEILTPVEDHFDGIEAARRGECGISALVIYDSTTGRYHIYDQHTVDEAVDHLNSADLLVGWNTIDFDSEAIAGVSGKYIIVPQFDMLAEAWKSLGKRKKGWKLTEVAKRTLGVEKNNDGRFASELAQSGQWGKLFDYCLNDVFMTKELYNHVVENGSLPDPEGNDVFLDPPHKEPI